MSEAAVHTIFVPEGWSTEQAWEGIRRGEPPTLEQQATGGWTNVWVDGDRYLGPVRPEPPIGGSCSTP